MSSVSPRPVLDFLEYALAEGGAAWVAEPSRAVYDTFRSMLVNRRWAGRCVWEKNIEALYPQERPFLCGSGKFTDRGCDNGRNGSFRRFVG